jgi:hypothetical protein
MRIRREFFRANAHESSINREKKAEKWPPHLQSLPNYPDFSEAELFYDSTMASFWHEKCTSSTKTVERLQGQSELFFNALF